MVSLHEARSRRFRKIRMTAQSAASVDDRLAPENAYAPRRRTTPSHALLRREAEDQARRAFLRTVSHELRTPLNAIIGFSEIIAGEMHGPLSDPRYRAHAEHVRDSGLKMLSLVNDILEIARLESDAVDLEPRPQNLVDAFACAAKAVAGQAAARGVTLTHDVDPPELLALADGRALVDVLRRLMENAIAFSPEGGSVRLRARPMARAVLIEIEDDGPGVSPRDVHRLLRPFQHGEHTPARGSHGAGLGLAVADLLCKAMGGRLHLQACTGRGLTAGVRLPAA